jgi:hypothetical protein
MESFWNSSKKVDRIRFIAQWIAVICSIIVLFAMRFPRIGSFWHSPEKVDWIRFIAQWIVVISTIIALIFAMRFSTLKNHADLTKTKADSEQRAVIENKISNLITETSSKEDEEKAFASGSKIVIRTDLLNK